MKEMDHFGILVLNSYSKRADRIDFRTAEKLFAFASLSI